MSSCLASVSCEGTDTACAELPMAPAKQGELNGTAEPTMTYNGLANGNRHDAQPSGPGAQLQDADLKPQV